MNLSEVVLRDGEQVAGRKGFPDSTWPLNKPFIAAKVHTVWGGSSGELARLSSTKLASNRLTWW